MSFLYAAQNARDEDSGEVARSEREQDDIEQAKEELAAADWAAQTEHCVDWLGDNATGAIVAALVFNDPSRPLESELRRSIAIRNLRTGYIEYTASDMEDDRALAHLGWETA